MTDAAQAVLDAAVAWRDAIERYEHECRRQHQPYLAYPEASGKRRSEDDDWHPGIDSVVAAARQEVARLAGEEER